MNVIFSVCLLELKRFKKSIIFILGIFILALFPLVLTPFVRTTLWDVKEAVYSYMLAFCSLLFMFTPILMIALYYEDSTTDMAKVIFTQPLNKYQYAFGKFLSVFLLQFAYVILGLIILTFAPVKFGKMPYVPYYFIEPIFLYYLPTAFFICSFCYFTIVLFKNPIIGFFLPILFYVFEDRFSQGNFQVIINGMWLSRIEKGNLTLAFQNAILTNRLIVTAAAMIFLFLALVIYSPKAYINKGGRI